MEHKIIVAGIGPGAPEYLLPAAKAAIEQAAVLVGSKRALAEFAPTGIDTKVIDKDISGVLAFIRERLNNYDVVVMVSGDPGFYSMLVALRQAFGADRLQVIPGISSVQLAFARIACPWQDAELISLHGREAADGQLSFQPDKKLGLLTDGNHTPRYIAGLLLASGWPAEAKVWLCADLSYPQERVHAATLGQVAGMDGFEHCVMVVMA